MNEVHLEISKKVSTKVEAIEFYKQLDEHREHIISLLLQDYEQGINIDLTQLNQWTKDLNQFAVKHQLPTRKIVSKEMFELFVKNM